MRLRYLPMMFRMIHLGILRQGQIHTRVVPSTRIKHPPVEQAIQQAWEQALSRPGVRLFDGPVCRMESINWQKEELWICLSQTSYRIVVGTNFANPDFADIYGPEVMANPLGVSTLVLTRDQYLMMGRRNDSVAYYPNRVHPFAGSLEVQAESIDLFDNVQRELREEIGLTPAEVESIRFLGLAEDLNLRHPESLFLTRTCLTREQIRSRLDPAEHHNTWSVPALVEPVSQVLDSPDALTPIAQSLLFCWLKLPSLVR